MFLSLFETILRSSIWGNDIVKLKSRGTLFLGAKMSVSPYLCQNVRVPNCPVPNCPFSYLGAKLSVFTILVLSCPGAKSSYHPLCCMWRVNISVTAQECQLLSSPHLSLFRNSNCRYHEKWQLEPHVPDAHRSPFFLRLFFDMKWSSKPLLQQSMKFDFFLYLIHWPFSLLV